MRVYLMGGAVGCESAAGRSGNYGNLDAELCGFQSMALTAASERTFNTLQQLRDLMHPLLPLQEEPSVVSIKHNQYSLMSWGPNRFSK